MGIGVLYQILGSEGKILFPPCWENLTETMGKVVVCVVMYSLGIPSNKFFALLQGQGIGNAKHIFSSLFQISSRLQGLSKFFVAVLCKDV